MNILELNFECTWRGGERQTIYNTTGFLDAGQNVALLCRKGYPLEENARAKGFTVYAFNNIISAIFFMIIKGRQFDVFHVQTSHVLTYCILTKPFHRAKVIFTRRVFFTPHGLMTRIKYRLCNRIVGISTAVKIVVEKFCGKKVTVIPDAAVEKEMNLEVARKIKKELAITPGVHVIGTIAVLSKEKDPVSIVEAIKLLYDKRQDFVFLHCGSGPLESSVRALIKKYGLEQVYKIIGFQENIESFFSVFDIFVMASLQEGMGSSVLDAFLYKVPVVSTDAGGLADIIKDGRAIMCRPGAPHMITNGIELLLNQPELKKQIVEVAYNYVKKEHSLAKITEQYMELFG